jgi:hypothetical protein
MSRDRLERLIKAIENLIASDLVAKRDGHPDPKSAHHLPHTEAGWFVRGTKRFLSGKEETLEGALKLKQPGRPVRSYKPENLKLAERALRLKKRGMTWEDVAQELYGHRSDPPSARYVQILIKRFTPVIEEKKRKAIVRKLRRRHLERSQTPPRLARAQGRNGRNDIEAVWLDANQELTPKNIKKKLRRQARKRRNSK